MFLKAWTYLHAAISHGLCITQANFHETKIIIIFAKICENFTKSWFCSSMPQLSPAMMVIIQPDCLKESRDIFIAISFTDSPQKYRDKQLFPMVSGPLQII